MTFPKTCVMAFLTLLLAMIALLMTSDGRALSTSVQNPAPLLAWEDWKSIGSCGGVDYLVAISKDDGSNDFELKIKIDNQNGHTVQTRLNALIESERGEKKYRNNV